MENPVKIDSRHPIHRRS